jgi:hypothetical protein
VEVPKAVNIYLPEEEVHRVIGTWRVCHIAAQASIWMFVYPRTPDLVRSYINGIQHAMKLEVVAWIGPVVDWEDFRSCFQVHSLADISHGTKIVPLTDSEIMVVVTLRRRVTDPAEHQMVDSI